MRNFAIKSTLILVGIIILLTLPFSFFIVGPNEYAAVFKFGKIVSVTDTPGLKYKAPGMYTVQYISKRLHLYDIPRSGVNKV